MLQHLRRRLARWRDYRETIYRLDRLDRHILADIGIERADIPCWAASGRTLEDR